MADVTFNLLAAKAAALRGGRSRRVKTLGKDLRRSLRRDRRERIRKVSEEAEEKLEKGDIIGAYSLIRPWYTKFSGKAPIPSVERGMC